MGKASSEDAITDAELAEMEDIAEKLPSKGISHDASDLSILEKLIEEQPDLVPRKPTDYYEAFRKYKEKKPGYTSQRKVAQSEKLESHGSVGIQFRAIEDAIAKIREGTFETATVEIPALTQERTAQILKKGVHVQLDPYALLPPEDHAHYKLSRYFQRRRGPRQHKVPRIADSIAKIGMIEPPTIQDGSSENGFMKRIIDGFNRIQAWIIANEQAGGSAENPVLELPVCLVVDCTNAEGELIALEKNQNKDNFDVGDRDYSIVLMYENHPQTYPQKNLCEIFNLNKSTVSDIISAWRESWPTDVKKGHTPIDNPIRQALVDRKITTYHGRLLARVKKWPSEQRRLGRWLLKNVKDDGREDALIRRAREHDEDQGNFTYFEYDYSGVSAGQLGSMVRTAVANMKNAEAVKREVSKLLKEDKIESTISETDYEKLRAKLSKQFTNYSDGITKGSMKIGLKGAGVKVQAPKPDVESKKPVSPATAKTTAEEEPEPILVCKNCQAYYVDDVEELSRCLLSIVPTEENECAIQAIYHGRPMTTDRKCAHCGGLTLDKFLKDLEVEVKSDYEFDTHSHDICYLDALLAKYDIKGKCHSCVNADCQLVNLVEESHDQDEGSLDIEVKHCPQTRNWFDPRPKISIKDINKEVQKRVEAFVKESRDVFERAKAAEAAGRSA